MSHVDVEDGLVGGGERAVERVGEHSLALGAVAAVSGLLAAWRDFVPELGSLGAELSAVRHLNHLPFYTLQKPCKFPAAAADAAFDGALRDAENLRNIFVVHIFKVAEDDCLAQFGESWASACWMRTFSSRPAACDSCEGRGSARRSAMVGPSSVVGQAGVERVGGAVQPRAAEVVDQQVAGQGRDPGLEAALLGVEAGQVAVELEEDVLGQVFGVGGRAGEAVADGVDAAVLRDDELLPRLLVAGHALADEPRESFLLGLLFGGALQNCLVPGPSAERRPVARVYLAGREVLSRARR